MAFFNLKLPRKIANNLFLSFMAVFFVALLIGGAIFYKYGILPQRKAPVVSGEIIKFEESVYKNILQEWQNREEGFRMIKNKKYPNPFQP